MIRFIVNPKRPGQEPPTRFQDSRQNPFLQAKLSSLIEAALSGEEIIIAKRHKPLVRLAPLSDNRLIIAQALAEKLPALSADSVFDSYSVENLF